jgi:protein-disulfide isomerase-like protein with CxxC motif
MATKGRSGDSMLVHMTPGEVAGLQALAVKHGGELTINPETGLPEANFLKKILPAVAGIALGPAGFGLMSAGMAGLTVGGLTTLATGSLSRGLMAGMGAYGGASLAEGLMGSGIGAAQEAAMVGAGEGASQAAMNEAAAKATTDFMQKGALDRFTEGAGAAFSDPKGFVQGMGGMGKLAQTGLAAISPMMADKGVQTATPQQDTGNIRRFSYDPYGQTYTSQGVFPAAGYKGMAQGGIVALAEGGVSDQAVQNWFATNTGADDAKIAAAMQQFNVAPEQVARVTGVGMPEVQQRYEAALPSYFQANQDVAKAYEQNAYGMTPEQFAQTHYEKYGQSEQRAAPTAGVSEQAIRDYLGARPGLNDISIQQAMDQYGVSADQMARATGVGLAEVQDRYGLAKDLDAFSKTAPQLTDLQWAQYAVARDPGTFDPVSMAELARAVGLPVDQVMQRYSAVQHGLLVPEDDSSAAQKYLRENKDVFDWTRSQTGRDYMRTHALTADDIAWTHFNRYGLNEGRQWGAPEKTATPGGAANPYANPGDQTRNPDGSVTVRPNIPGRPEGGFTGMGQVRDAYTQGGGSLGYVNPAPKTMEEFDQRFNRQTGDSLAAYNYLMGKGANPIKSGVGEIMRPYSEATLGMPVAEGRPTQKYVYQNGRYVENPNYVPVTYDSKGNRNVGMSSSEVLRGFQALPDQTDDTAIFDWVDENKVTIAQLAAAMGITEAEAQRRMDAARKKTGTTSADTSSLYDMGGGGGDSGPGGDSVGAAGPAGDGGAAPGDGQGTAAGVGDTIATGGLVPRRMALGGLGALAKGGVAELPDGAFVLPARITSEVGNGSTNAGAQKLRAMEQRLLGKNAQPVNLGRYSGGGNLVRGAGDGVSDSVPATIGGRQPARIADGEYIVSREAVKKLGNGSTEAGARKLYAMMDRVQKARGKTTGKNRVAANTRSDKYLPA